MKKFVLFAAAAAALAGCAKTTISGDIADQTEITFEVAPLTKGLTTSQSKFSTDNVFSATAFYLADKKWTYSDNGASLYIEEATISYDATANVWRNATTKYYWPKTGKLTFFAWTLNKSNLNFPDGSGTYVGVSTYNGVVAMDYDIEINKNIDFMVADSATNKTANENVYSYTGVPTLFRHKLTQFQATVCEKEAYSGVTFTLKSISLAKLAKTGYYLQEPEGMNIASDGSSTTYYSSTTGQVVNTTTPTAVDNAGIDQYIYMPQKFTDDNMIEIKYDIAYDTNGDGKADVTETVTEPKKLSEIFGAEWKMGYKYTLKLTFSVDEILWDPAVQEWDPVSKDVTII